MQDWIDNAEPRVIAMALIGLLLLLFSAEVMYLLWPQFKSYKQLNNSHTLLLQASSNSGSLNEQLTVISKEVEKLSRDLHGDMAALPERQMESFVIGRLQKVSWTTDVELISVEPGRGSQVQNFRESLFEVKLNAHYHDFFAWLQIVNDELGYVVVKKFEIRPNDRGKLEDPRLDFVLTLVSYRMLQNNAS